MTEMGKLGWSAPEKRDPMIARIPLGSFAGELKVSAALFMV